MAKNRPSLKEVAHWRLERIEEALDEQLSRSQRSQIVERISKTPVLWPSGQTKTISVPTLYRWISLYQMGQLEALIPKRRSDLGVKRTQLPEQVVQEALRILLQDPGITYTFLVAVLQTRFAGHKIARSTLQERLSASAEYKRIKRLRSQCKRRCRFVAAQPHDIWQCDAKGPFRVTFDSGEAQLVHILSIIDDATRAVLAIIVSQRANLGAATRVFRMAAVRWGLAKMLYVDRAKIFDSKAFRSGLANMGSHRIAAKPRSPEARGKIEAYHRTLGLWFVERLAQQKVVDLQHLQQLLDGVIYGLYQTHKHRGLKAAPAHALNDRVSPRHVPPTRLVDAFRQDRKLKAHRKTGEVEIDGVTYLVADELRGHKLVFRVDPAGEHPPLVLHPTTEQPLSIRRAAIKPQDLAEAGLPAAGSTARAARRWGAGNLQALYDSWQGQKRPLADPGFGLPELYDLLCKACGRHVPSSDAEAQLIQHVYQTIGPLPKEPTERALTAIAQQLGPNRPVKTYLDELHRRVQQNSPHEKDTRL